MMIARAFVGDRSKVKGARSLVALIAALIAFFDLRQAGPHKFVVIFLLLTTIVALVVEWEFC